MTAVSPPLRSAAAALLVMFLARPPAVSAEVSAAASLVFDSNLFESPSDPQAGLVNRLTFSVDGNLAHGPRVRSALSFQGGLKRFWASPRQPGGGAGVMAANRVSASVSCKPAEWLAVSGTGTAKLKSVSGVPGEEGYLHGSTHIMGNARISPSLRAGLTGLFAREASRDSSLPDAHHADLTAVVTYSRSRRLRLRAAAGYRGITYGRSALLETDGNVSLAGYEQFDRQFEFLVGAQVFRGALFDAAYVFIVNGSNSFGYAYRAHRVRFLLARALPWETDGQAYLGLGSRRYRESARPASSSGLDSDDYEMTSLVLKASRPVSNRLSAGLQYAYYRNGSVLSSGHYRKQVFSISIESSL